MSLHFSSYGKGLFLRWTWDPDENHDNKRTHRLGFETAQLVFDDPLAVSRQDSYPHELRWQTNGLVGPVVLLVVHTSPDPDRETGVEVGRIISARKATRRERKA